MRDVSFESPIETAKRLGTYGKINRRAQYESDRYSTEKLRLNDDLLFEKVRALEALENRKFWHRLIVVISAAVISRMPEIVAFLKRFLF